MTLVLTVTELADQLGPGISGAFTPFPVALTVLLAFTHARVFDAEAKTWNVDQTVVIAGEKIVAIGPSAQLVPPAGAEIIDATGQAILPGLWDIHIHPDYLAETGANVVDQTIAFGQRLRDSERPAAR